MKFDPPARSRWPAGTKGLNYSHPGVFFVTLCSFQRMEIFGTLVDNEMQCSPLGKIVRTEWFNSARTHKEIQLFKTEFVLMPNHLHGIVWVVGDESMPAKTIRAHTIRSDAIPSIDNPVASTTLRRIPHPLAAFIPVFKAAVTSRAAAELDSTDIWQPNEYQNIIRNENELNEFRVYIHTNPLHWHKDQLHPSAPANRFNQDTP